MARRENRTLRELTSPNIDQQPLCITYQQEDEGGTFELKSGLIHLLPSFHGSNGEDPNKFLSEFHVVCGGMRPNGATEEKVKLRAFPFALKDAAKDWLYYLPPGCVTTWAEMKKRFLEKYFPASKSSTLKKEISNIEQNSDESFYEYWERFKRLCASCPYHGYHDEDLIMYFYNGLVNDDVRMINVASGGSILNNTSEAARALIEELAEGSRQFNKRSHDKRAIRENVSTESKVGKLEDQMQALTSMMRDFMVKGKAQQVKSCGICSFNHPTNSCPQLQEEGNEEVSSIGFQN